MSCGKADCVELDVKDTARRIAEYGLESLSTCCTTLTTFHDDVECCKCCWGEAYTGPGTLVWTQKEGFVNGATEDGI